MAETFKVQINDKSKVKSLTPICMIQFFKKRKTISREEKFWNYFIDNKKSLEDFIDSDLSDYRPYNKVTEKMRIYSDYLFPELTKDNDDKYVLVITPDGDPKGIMATENLYNSKPEIESWVVVKFRQPKDDFKEFEYQGLKYPSSDIEILSQFDGETEKMNLKIFIRNMNSDEAKYKTMAWIYLDNIIGEYNSITKLGYVDFIHLDSDKSIKDSISILELRNKIDKEIYKVV